MSPDSRAPLADGALEIREGRHVVRFQRHLAHPIERVWAALTEPDELIGWWGAADRSTISAKPTAPSHASGAIRGQIRPASKSRSPEVALPKQSLPP